MSNKQKRSDDEEGDRKKQKVESIDAWFVKQQRTPVAFDIIDDGFVLDATNQDTTFAVKKHADRDDRRNQKGRQLWSFENNAVVIKHCAPWGESAILCNHFFTIVKKYFSSSGKPRHIVVRQTSLPHNEYLLEEPFFSGWSAIDDHGDMNYDYLADNK